MTKEIRKNLIAVYGSLRKGLGNHKLLENAKYLGEFESSPSFTMYSVSNCYPGLLRKGNTSIIMEAYLVSDKELERINVLEGYRDNQTKSLNHYNKETLETPFGVASWYEYNRNPVTLRVVESGDWTRFMKSQHLIK